MKKGSSGNDVSRGRNALKNVKSTKNIKIPRLEDSDLENELQEEAEELIKLSKSKKLES